MSQKAASGNPLGSMPIGQLILKFAVPATISMLANAIYNIVDQIFIGRGIGTEVMAATTVAFPLVTISTAIALLLGVGGASNFSLLLGRGDPDRASAVAGNSISVMVIAGVVLGVASLVFLEPLLRAFGATDFIMPYAKPYTLIIAIGLPFAVFSAGASNLIRADGRPTYSMVCVLAGGLFNLIFDPIFLYVFDMGLNGIALATILGQLLSSALAAWYLLRRFRSVPLRRRHLRPSAPVVRSICALGAAACVNQLAMAVSQVVSNNTLRIYADPVFGEAIPQASAGAISKIVFIFMAFVLGIAQGCQPITGYNYGARKYDRVKKAYRLALIGATVASIVAFSCYQLFPRQILSIFGTGTEEYYAFGIQYLRVFLMMTCINGIQPITSNFFTSIGRANLGLWMSLTRQILVLVPMMLLLPIRFGVDGFMFSGPIADVISAALAIFFIVREMRRMNEHAIPEEVAA